MTQWLRDASELDLSERWCTCCERNLRGRVRMLEHDMRFDTYHDYGDIPVADSRGCFPFGIACAKREQRKETQRRCRPTPVCTPTAPPPVMVSDGPI